MKYSVVDVETTGLFPGRGDRVVEIAVIEVAPDGTLGEEFVSVVNPGRDIGPTRIHGLTSADVARAPRFEDLAGELLARLQGTVALAAHNAYFDHQFLTAEFDRLELQIPDVPRVCTMQLAGGGKLQECCCRFGLPEPDEGHSALDDARAAARLLARFLHQQRVPSFPPLSWPVLTRGAIVPVTRTQARQQAQENPYLSRLGALASEQGTAADHSAAALAYMSLLERVLEDRCIEETEAELLISTALTWGLQRPQVEEIHAEFLRHIAVAALLDGVVTDAERRDLHSVAGLLGVPQTQIDGLLNEAAQRLNSVSSLVAPSSAKESLEGKSVCFTGELIGTINGRPITREQAQLLAKNAGLQIAASVTKKLDLLVVADPNTQSGKAKKAREYGTRILAENVFWKTIGANVD